MVVERCTLKKQMFIYLLKGFELRQKRGNGII